MGAAAHPGGLEGCRRQGRNLSVRCSPAPLRSGTRDHTITISGVRVRSQVNYYQLKDGTTLEVGSIVPSGGRC